MIRVFLSEFFPYLAVVLSLINQTTLLLSVQDSLNKHSDLCLIVVQTGKKPLYVKMWFMWYIIKEIYFFIYKQKNVYFPPRNISLRTNGSKIGSR